MKNILVAKYDSTTSPTVYSSNPSERKSNKRELRRLSPESSVRHFRFANQFWGIDDRFPTVTQFFFRESDHLEAPMPQLGAQITFSGHQCSFQVWGTCYTLWKASDGYHPRHGLWIFRVLSPKSNNSLVQRSVNLVRPASNNASPALLP